MTKNADDDDHDRLVDPLVANYLAKQFACAQTNRLKYPLLQIHIIIIFFFFIIVANSHHHCHLLCCYRNKCTNFSLSLSLDGIECFRKCWRADCKAEQAIRESKMQQGEGANKVCVILYCKAFCILYILPKESVSFYLAMYFCIILYTLRARYQL